MAKLKMSHAAAAAILPPKKRRGEYEEKPIGAWVVRIWEATPPKNATKVEWILICLNPVTSVSTAWRMSNSHGCRWMVEEYHKAQKTGCQIEDLHFRTEQALQPMIAILSVVSLMLLNLREAARRPDAKERKASEAVDSIHEEVLRGWRYKACCEELTAYEFYMALARLGGHMNRKGDGFPVGSFCGVVGRCCKAWHSVLKSTADAGRKFVWKVKSLRTGCACWMFL